MSREEARRNTRARFEQWASNPTCEANTLSAVHNVRMDSVASSVGLTPSFGQSPFAIARGNVFEAGLFRNNAERLRSALERKECLPADSEGFLDLRLKLNGGISIATVDTALAETRRWLMNLDAGRATETIVAAPMIKIPRGVILPEALLIIDVVTVTRVDEQPVVQVGEIKVFPDRGGHTDPRQLSSARAQAGLYQRALEMAVAELGLERVKISRDGVLVFTWPGSNQPSIRAVEDLTYQSVRAERGFARLEAVAQSIVRDDDFEADQPALIDRVLHAETTYSDACLGFCDLAPRCHQDALDADRGIILGEPVDRVLGSTTISRALELMNGESPVDDRERDLQRQLGGEL